MGCMRSNTHSIICVRDTRTNVFHNHLLRRFGDGERVAFVLLTKMERAHLHSINTVTICCYCKIISSSPQTHKENKERKHKSKKKKQNKRNSTWYLQLSCS